MKNRFFNLAVVFVMFVSAVAFTVNANNIKSESSVVVYGPCNAGCGCRGYVSRPGQTACISCASHGCKVNKFGHRRIQMFSDK